MSETTVTLLENAYAFVNEAIRNSRRAKLEARYWSFAILHLIQGLELLMKHVLQQQHPVLIYENIDNPKNTGSLSLCLERLKTIAKLEIDEKEERVIRRAITQRNKIVHHEYEVNRTLLVLTINLLSALFFLGVGRSVSSPSVIW